MYLAAYLKPTKFAEKDIIIEMISSLFFSGLLVMAEMPQLTQDRYSTLSYEEKRCQMLPSPSSSVPISLSLHHMLLFLQVHLQWSIFLFTSFNDSCFGVSRPLILKANDERRERIIENEGKNDQKNKWAIIRVWTNPRIRNAKEKGRKYLL